MQVLLGGNLLATLSDSEILGALNDAYRLSGVTGLANSAWTTMLYHYRQYMRDGMSDTWVTNEMKRQRANITGNIGPAPDDMQIAAFISTMKQLKAGVPVQNPTERPSWVEVLKDSPLNPKNDTMQTILYAAGGLLILYGIATTATRSIFTRK